MERSECMERYLEYVVYLYFDGYTAKDAIQKVRNKVWREDK